MRRLVLIAVITATVLLIPAGQALAGSAHFVGTPEVTRDGDLLTVTGKVAGLGDETQIDVEVTADVQCVNRGDNEPQAENKDDVIAAESFPVQNGKALFEVSGTGTTDPDCEPPMRLIYRNIVVTVSGDSFATFSFIVPGTF